MGFEQMGVESRASLRHEARRVFRDPREEVHAKRKIRCPQEGPRATAHRVFDAPTLVVPSRGAADHGAAGREALAHIDGGGRGFRELDRHRRPVQHRGSDPGGRDVGFVYAHGRVLKKVDSAVLIDTLFEEIDKWIAGGMKRPKRLKMGKPAALAMAEN